jgi:hypothetical protein
VNRFDHRVTGAVAGGTYAAVLGLPLAPTVACMWAGSITAAGKFSPDIDQYPQWHGRDPDVDQWWWVRRLRGFLLLVGPDDHGDPVDHRRITHWWGVPAAVAAPIVVGAAYLPDRTTTPPEGLQPVLAWGATWIMWVAFLVGGAFVAGWASHVIADAPFGRRSRYRGPGVPFMPWWSHHGANLKSAGWLAHLTVWLVIVPGGAATFMRFDLVGETARACLGS